MVSVKLVFERMEGDGDKVITHELGPFSQGVVIEIDELNLVTLVDVAMSRDIAVMNIAGDGWIIRPCFQNGSAVWAKVFIQSVI